MKKSSKGKIYKGDLILLPHPRFQRNEYAVTNRGIIQIINPSVAFSVTGKVEVRLVCKHRYWPTFVNPEDIYKYAVYNSELGKMIPLSKHSYPYINIGEKRVSNIKYRITNKGTAILTSKDDQRKLLDRKLKHNYIFNKFYGGYSVRRSLDNSEYILINIHNVKKQKSNFKRGFAFIRECITAFNTQKK